MKKELLYRYYSEEPGGFNHCMIFRGGGDSVSKYKDWLNENIGSNDKWYGSFWYFYFKDIEDAMAFKLRWT